MDYIIVSNERRLPLDVTSSGYRYYTGEEFIEEANSGGLDMPDIYLYFDANLLNKDLYESLLSLDERVVNKLKFYYFVDSKPTDISYIQNVIEYDDSVPEEDEEEIVEEVIEETPINVQPVETVKSDSNRSESIMPVSGTLDTGKLTGLLDPDVPIEGLIHSRKSMKPARVVLFGSSKGGTGKTFTCLLSVYRYARTHPYEKIAVADFDIIDGQIGITLSKITPTLLDYYKQYRAGNNTFDTLQLSKVQDSNFGPNVDFYLAPPVDLPEITNDTRFWQNVFEELIKNYDVVFFDSGIDYLGKPPISKLYQIADKIIITTNTTINSVKSIIKQAQALSGKSHNSVFKPEMKILNRVNLVLTRKSTNEEINTIVRSFLVKVAPIIVEFGDLDSKITYTQWYLNWAIWNDLDDINMLLDKIVE